MKPFILTTYAAGIILVSAIIILGAGPPIDAMDEVRSIILKLSQKEVTLDGSSFPGLYYDMDYDSVTEKLTFRLSDIAPDGSSAVLSDKPDANGNRGIVYTTAAEPYEFDFSPWGQYEEIRFLGGDYFAAYDGNPTWSMNETGQSVPFLYDRSDSKNLMINEQISEILIDTKDEENINMTESLMLEEGYELAIRNISSDGKKVYVDLRKNGEVIDSKVISPSIEGADIGDETYYYRKDLGGTKDIVLIAVHIKSVFSSAGMESARVDGIFQISETPVRLNSDIHYGKMSVREIDPTALTIKMDNKDNKITLRKNEDILLMDRIHIFTADQDEINASNPLRYYVYKDVAA